MNALERIEASAFSWDGNEGALLEMFSHLHEEYLAERQVECSSVSDSDVLENVIERLSQDEAARMFAKADAKLVFDVLYAYFSNGFSRSAEGFSFEAMPKTSLLYGDEYFEMSKRQAIGIVAHALKSGYRALAKQQRTTDTVRV